VFLKENSIKKFAFNCVGIVIIIVIISVKMSIHAENERKYQSLTNDMYSGDASDTTKLTGGMDAQITFVDGQPVSDMVTSGELGSDMSNTTDLLDVTESELGTEEISIPGSFNVPEAGDSIEDIQTTYPPLTEIPVSTPTPTYAPVIVSTPTPTYAPIVVSTPTPTRAPVIVSTPTPVYTPAPTPKPTQKPTSSSEYILPYSNSRFYTRSEISGLSASELRLARNEIYARHGAIFTSADLDAHFRSCSWYRPTISVSQIDEDAAFNVYEYTNMEVIRGLE